MNEISIVDVGTFFIAITALGLSIYNTWKQHNIRGPEFNLTEARIEHRSTTIDGHFTFNLLIQNIGDRMGFLRWKEIYIKLPSKAKTIRIFPEEWEWQAYSGTQKQEEFFSSILPSLDLTGGYLVAEGVYSSHEGKMIEKTWETPLTGILKPIKIEERKEKDDS